MAILNSFIVNKYPQFPVRSKPRMILSGGAELGIPLNLFSNIYTSLHYGDDITTIQSILIQFLLGYYVYGIDRLKDAKEYNILEKLDKEKYGEKKQILYDEINNNPTLFKFTLNLSLLILCYLLFIDNYDITHLPFFLLIYLCGEYKSYKQNLSIFKSSYISIMWTIGCVILPCVLYENNYSILNSPLDYVPCGLLIFGSSNFADIPDLEEDKLNGIKTLAVEYGKEISNFISIIALGLASILVIENPNFDQRLIINSLLEAQQLGLMYLIYNNTYIN